MSEYTMDDYKEAVDELAYRVDPSRAVGGILYHEESGFTDPFRAIVIKALEHALDVNVRYYRDQIRRTKLDPAVREWYEGKAIYYEQAIAELAERRADRAATVSA